MLITSYSPQVRTTPSPQRRLVSEQPVANANWQPQNDGVVLSGNQPESQAPESPIGLGPMKNVPQGSWVTPASANTVKAEFQSLDGFHFSGAMVDRSQAVPHPRPNIPSADQQGSISQRPVKKDMSWGQKFVAVITLPVNVVRAVASLVKDGPSGMLLGPSPAGAEKNPVVKNQTLFSTPFPTL